jgi:hypothetical protein
MLYLNKSIYELYVFNQIWKIIYFFGYFIKLILKFKDCKPIVFEKIK